MNPEVCTCVPKRSINFEFCTCSECRVKWAAAIFYTYGNTKPIIEKIEQQVKDRGSPLRPEFQVLLDSVKNGTAPREGQTHSEEIEID